MLPGTIVMLFFIVIVVFGGAGFLVSKNLKNEKKHLSAKEVDDASSK